MSGAQSLRQCIGRTAESGSGTLSAFKAAPDFGDE